MVIHFKDKTYILTKDNPDFQKILDAVSSNNLKEVGSIVDANELYKECGIVLRDDGMIYLNGIPIDTILKKE